MPRPASSPPSRSSLRCFGAWAALDNLTGLLAEPGLAGLGIALMPFAATAVAFQAAKAAEAAWARVLGGAAVMLGVLSSLGGVLYFLASYRFR